MVAPLAPQTPRRSLFQRVPDEAWPGVALLAAAAAAMIIANSPAADGYFAALKTQGIVGFGDAAIDIPLSSWVKNLLMAVFFFYVGLELKRELMEGALSTPATAALPLAGAVGGMALPAILYLLFTPPQYAHGWAIPAATDIAFALGVLALLGSRVPAALKAFLLAVAVIDDLGAILIIAFVYTAGLSAMWLMWAALFFGVMLAMNALGVRRIGVYVFAAVPLWVAMQNSGVNPTLAGVLAAAAIPLRPHPADPLRRSLLHDVEHAIRPYVLFGVMPLFALAAAGAALGAGLAAALAHPVALGVAAGLAIGKPLGITGLTLLAARLLKTPLPGRPVEVFGVAAIAGIGFTMSLFIGALAFADPALQAPVRVGVYAGSLLSAAIGLLILARALPARSAAAATVENDPARPFMEPEDDYLTPEELAEARAEDAEEPIIAIGAEDRRGA